MSYDLKFEDLKLNNKGNVEGMFDTKNMFI